MHSLRLPQRIVATGSKMLTILGGNTISPPDETKASNIAHPAIRRVRSLLPTCSTAFDQGKAGNGNAWTVKYAPSSANDILQPTASLLRDWMRSLTTSVTQKQPTLPGGKTTQASKRLSRKKKRRKISDELEGFIASSDEESEGDYGRQVKNAVLISGPPGCGKTASVFAVAKELDFEVFEVHPGMRRSAKDIFDKVGDMTQNHLVQGAENGTTPEIDPSTIELDSTNQEIASGKQGTMRKFFSKTHTGKQRKSPPEFRGKEIEYAKAPKTQKQSIILLEEVDVLFEEDKGFWSGVISLISQSKRPIVLTCNDESSIPFDDLVLHATWRYEPPTLDVASEYLVTLAANEGHVLSRDCVRALFKSKRHDLRATINELDFWCQMGIGSEKGGLDWMLDPSSSSGPTETANAPLRVFSKDTYASGAGLALPLQVSYDQRQEELLNQAQNYLGIPVTGWHEASDVLHTTQSSPIHVEQSQKQIDDLQRAVNLLDSRSVLDLFAESLTATLSVRIKAALTPNRSILPEEDVVRAYFTKTEPSLLTNDDLLSALEPLTVEKASFPPALGRLAPSFEGPTSIIATDIAPYVRSIVAFDQRLEQQREVMTGDLQGRKVRKTRAARAALEGGSKANTRRERWFPERTDFEKVMKTAGKGWRLCVQDEDSGPSRSQCSVETSSPGSDADEDEH
jgi:DNA polymerase III delta prime subunit